MANPIQSVKKPAKGKRSRVLTDEEQTKILNAIPDARFKRFVWAMQEAGCRPSEVAWITAAQVNFEQGLWVLEDHKTAKKTNRPRIVYLTPAMIDLCKELVEKHPIGPLFRNRLGKRYSKNAIVCRSRRLRENLPHMTHFVCYSLRHSYATKHW